MEAVECGAAALAIVLGYFGRLVPLEEARLECGVSRDGSKASNIVKAARNYGLEAKGYRKEPRQCFDLPFPQIIHWNFNHFIVLEGYDRKRVYLNDPAAGPRTVPHDEFDQSFTGITMTFTPGPQFRKGGHKRSMLAALQRRLVGAKLPLTYVIGSGLLLVVPGLIVPAFSKVFVDNILVKQMTGWAVPLLIGLGVAAVLQALITWLQEYNLLRLSTRISLKESSAFFWHVLRLPVEFFTQRYGGEIGSRVAINDRIAQIVTEQFGKNAINLFNVAFYALLMFAYSVPLTLVGIGIAAINVVVLKLVTRIRVDRSQKMLIEGGKLQGVSMGGLQSIETLKAAGREADFFGTWAGYQAKFVNAQQELSRLTQVLNNIPTLLQGISSAIMLLCGGLLIMGGRMSIGTLVAFQTLLTSFLNPFQQLVQLAGTIQEMEGDMNRLDDVTRYRLDCAFGESAPPDDGRLGAKLSGELVLDKITFGYSRLEPPLLTDFSLQLKPGQRIALVGASGSGKSTVAKLVTGQYQPWSGEIRLDGRPRTAIPRHLRENSVAMVDQEIFLFEGSVRDNLTLWDTSIPYRDIVAAARDAAIHDEVAARAGGYDSAVAEAGGNFSGGQRQRLEIARALVNNPTLLILDEATSALDPTTEKAIDDQLRRRGCACLIVAHRLSTIRDADEIIVLDKGVVVERGTHATLKDAGGAYSRLIQGT